MKYKNVGQILVWEIIYFGINILRLVEIFGLLFGKIKITLCFEERNRCGLENIKIIKGVHKTLFTYLTQTWIIL